MDILLTNTPHHRHHLHDHQRFFISLTKIQKRFQYFTITITAVKGHTDNKHNCQYLKLSEPKSHKTQTEKAKEKKYVHRQN